jgi:hypothetical protein
MQTKHIKTHAVTFACAAIALTLCSRQAALGQSAKPADKPTIKFDVVPAIEPGPAETAPLKGRVVGLASKDFKDHKIVLYSKGGDTYYVQPREDDMLTDIEKDGTFSADVHGGTEYVAFLVKKSYKPKKQIYKLPEEGEDILAIEKRKPGKKD